MSALACGCCGAPVQHRNEHRQFRDGRAVRYVCRYSEAWLAQCRAVLDEIEAERELLADCRDCGALVIRYANAPTLYELDRATGHNCASSIEEKRPVAVQTPPRPAKHRAAVVGFGIPILDT